MQCQICQAELPAGARICPACGAPTPYNVLEPAPSEAPSSSPDSPDDTLIKRRSETSEQSQSTSVEDSERTLRAPYSEPTVRAPSRWQQSPSPSGEAEAPAQPRTSQTTPSEPERAPQQASPGAGAAPSPASSGSAASAPSSATPAPPPRDIATSYGWSSAPSGPATPSYGGPSGVYPAPSAQTPAVGLPPQSAGHLSQSGSWATPPGYQQPPVAQPPGPTSFSGSFYPGYPPPPSAYTSGQLPAVGAGREAGAGLPQQGQAGWPPLPQPAPLGTPGPGTGFPPVAPTPVAPGAARGGRSTIVFILAVLLVCLMVLLGTVVYLGVIRPGQEHAAATATAQSATALARSHQTATAIARANATATMTALQNDPQAFYSYVISQPPQVNDALTGQSASNWDDTLNSDGSGCQFNNGALHVLTTAETPLWACIANALTYQNLAFQVDMKITKGNNNGLQTLGGLVFRFNEGTRSFYSLLISPSGAYLLSKFSNEDFTALSEGVSNAINTNLGQSNTLTVIAQENILIVFVNQHYLTTVHDSNLTSGQIGLIALDTSKTPVDAAFQNMKIWRL